MLIATAGIALAQPNGSLRGGSVEVGVKPLGYEEAASFYIARGLPRPLVDRYARPCVVVVVVRAEGSAPEIFFSLGQWRVRAGQAGALAIRGRGEWLAELDREGIPWSPRMAFEWAQLPEQASLIAGDSVQGMLSLPVARGAPFDLVVRWRAAGAAREGSIDQLRCD